MPRVPTYDAFEVTPKQLPGVSRATASTVASPSLFDAGAKQISDAGKGLLKAGSDLNDVAVNIQDRENADMVFRAETAAKNNYLDFLNSVRSRRGQDAWGVTRDAGKWWDEQAIKQSEDLQNDVQRQLFQQKMATLRTQSLGNISFYETDQRRKSLADSAQASIVGSINMAAASPNDTAIVLGAKSDILKRLQVLGKINGWSPELYAAKKSEYITDLHKQVFQSMVDSDPAEARAYYEMHKDEIAGSARDVFEKQIATSTRRRTVQSFGDAVMGDGMNETDALALAHKQFSGEDEDAAVREIRGRFADADAARERGQRDAADQAWGVLAKTGKIDAVPAATLSQMDGRQVLALRKEADSLARGTPVQTDPGTYYDLSQKAANDPQGFEKLDLRDYFDKLAPVQRRHFMDMQQKMKEPAEVESVATFTQQLNAMHNELGWGASDRTKKGQFDAAVSARVDAEQQRLGRKLSYDETQQIIHRMAVSEGGFWTLGKTYFYQVAGTPAAEQFIKDIDVPSVERDKIAGALKRHGDPVTDETIKDLYLRHLGFTNAK